MTSSSDTFPFGIADVVELLGLTVRRRLPSSLYLNCPFCGDQRGRLNVNTDKNVWRCNRCGAAGGMLALYAHYYCTSNADAYREICEALGRYTPRPRVNDCIGIKPEQNARATPQEIHQTYSLLLSMLPLTPTHKAHLLSPRRGLTEYQIARFGLKSTPPAFLCRGYAERLRRQGCTLQGVPGFYQDDAGRWTINFGSRTAGILLPAVGLDGLICGILLYQGCVETRVIQLFSQVCGFVRETTKRFLMKNCQIVAGTGFFTQIVIKMPQGFCQLLTLISGCFYQFHISCEPTIFKQFSNALGNRFPRNDLRSGAVNGRGTFGKVDTVLGIPRTDIPAIFFQTIAAVIDLL